MKYKKTEKWKSELIWFTILSAFLVVFLVGVLPFCVGSFLVAIVSLFYKVQAPWNAVFIEWMYGMIVFWIISVVRQIRNA